MPVPQEACRHCLEVPMNRKKCAVLGIAVFFCGLAGLLFADSPKKTIMSYSVDSSPLPGWFGEEIQKQAEPVLQKFILGRGHLPAAVKSREGLSGKNPRLFRFHLNIKVSLEGTRGTGAPEYLVIRKWVWTDRLSEKQRTGLGLKETVVGDCLGAARGLCASKIGAMLEKDLKGEVPRMMALPPTEDIPEKRAMGVPQWPGQTQEQYEKLRRELSKSEEKATDEIQKVLEEGTSIFDGKDFIKR